MSKKRKSWEPVYRFGGNPRDPIKMPLGENKSPYTVRHKPKRGK